MNVRDEVGHPGDPNPCVDALSIRIAFLAKQERDQTKIRVRSNQQFPISVNMFEFTAVCHKAETRYCFDKALNCAGERMKDGINQHRRGRAA